ncbi:hypothetical protein A1O3_04203 [Capronia epimyces CBS 606.96]|uniref:Ketoreductase domain-containing protein n=1 Tax=Capronia epimyces CBS 606.96 TaxID=1182542 RepID=W9YY67_9EURO|nr:uncharacterized protein A1O3_04203 [Capronia epimyces CBS 606.96]EXJ87244.1 hypothetical protein A1O3_04203 [Capronia epimyces CBS 606.96]
MPDKTVLITGCSAGGIGYALAQHFQKRGLTVFATARSLSSMTGLETLPNTTLLALDVTKPAEMAAAVEEVQTRTGGKLDYLVNNSGQQQFRPVLDHDIDQAKDMFEVNFWGVVRMVQAFAPLLIQAKGTLVNIGSIAAYLCPPFSGIYNASKAAVHALDETLRIELAPLQVKVLTVVTGSISTLITKKSPPPNLPPTSKYLPTEEYMEHLIQGTANFTTSKPAVFAEQVVQDVLNGVTGKTFRGANATATRFLPPLVPTFVKDKILTNGTGLDKVGK